MGSGEEGVVTRQSLEGEVVMPSGLEQQHYMAVVLQLIESVQFGEELLNKL